MSDDLKAFARLRALAEGQHVPWYGGVFPHEVETPIFQDLKALVRFLGDVTADNARLTTERDAAQEALDGLRPVCDKALKERDRLAVRLTDARRRLKGAGLDA